jgi:hypothetical protein
MKDAAFRELVASVRQAGRIRRGTLRASRTRVFRPADIKAVRAKLTFLPRVVQAEHKGGFRMREPKGVKRRRPRLRG